MSSCVEGQALEAQRRLSRTLVEQDARQSQKIERAAGDSMACAAGWQRDYSTNAEKRRWMSAGAP